MAAATTTSTLTAEEKKRRQELVKTMKRIGISGNMFLASGVANADVETGGFKKEVPVEDFFYTQERVAQIHKRKPGLRYVTEEAPATPSTSILGQLGMPPALGRRVDLPSLTPRYRRERSQEEILQEANKYGSIKAPKQGQPGYPETAQQTTERQASNLEKQKKLASMAYSGLSGNYKEFDGWDFRGTGDFQLSHRDNWKQSYEDMKAWRQASQLPAPPDFREDPELLRKPENREFLLEANAFYFKRHVYDAYFALPENVREALAENDGEGFAIWSAGKINLPSASNTLVNRIKSEIRKAETEERDTDFSDIIDKDKYKSILHLNERVEGYDDAVDNPTEYLSTPPEQPPAQPPATQQPAAQQPAAESEASISLPSSLDNLRRSAQPEMPEEQEFASADMEDEEEESPLRRLKMRRAKMA